MTTDDDPTHRLLKAKDQLVMAKNRIDPHSNAADELDVALEHIGNAKEMIDDAEF